MGRAASNPENLLTNLATRATDAFLAPFIVAPNLGLAAVNAGIGSAARLGEIGARTAARAEIPLAKYAEHFSRRVAESTFAAAQKSLDLAADSARKAAGTESEHSSNHLLAQTVLDRGGQTAALPLILVAQSVAAALEVEPFRKAAWDVWLVINRLLDNLSIKGVLPGEVGDDTNATVRAGFYYMTTEGPLGAIARDIRGVAGGFGALALGDFEWLGEALPRYRESMEYVWDKKLHDCVQPESDFPIGEVLGNDGEAAVLRYAEGFAEALESGEPLEVLSAAIRDFGLIWTLVTTYPSSEFRVLFDVLKFVAKAWVEAGDAQSYALCELAIMESSLASGQKDEALARLRKTADNATIEFEYYVPLLVPFTDTGQQRAERRDAAGNVLPDVMIAKSVFQQIALDRAQSITSEVISLRSFLWLYGDEDTARQKNHGETIRKFGPEAAERIRDKPMYPMTREQIERLTADGPRPRQEINDILVELLRKRGLLYVSEQVAQHLPAAPKKAPAGKRRRKGKPG